LIRLCRSIARVCQEEIIDRLDAEAPISSALGFPDSLTLHRTYSHGPLLAIQSIWERLGIGEVLRTECRDCRLWVPYEQALLALTANRLCEPESKLGSWQRWPPTVYLPLCWDRKMEQMYEAMDFIHEQAGLTAQFERLERERICPGRHQAFHKMIEDLSQVYWAESLTGSRKRRAGLSPSPSFSPGRRA